jgi:hypothetical protein
MPSAKASGGPERPPIIPARVSTKTKAATGGSHRSRVDVGSATAAKNNDSPAPAPAPALRSALSVIATVGTPLTIITALMLYFGWARSDAQSKWMGIDVSLFHFSSQDYVLRSVRTLFVPLLVVGVVGIAWLELHRRIAASVDRAATGRAVRVAGAVTMCVGLATAIIGVVLAALQLHWRLGPVVFPLLLGAGAAVAAYGHQLSRLGAAPSETDSSAARWQDVLQILLVGLVIAGAAFWAVGEYAQIVGRGIAENIEQNSSALPKATAISESPLGIDAPHVETAPITVGPKTLYRTTGLRLLGESGGRLFLLNEGWNRRGGRIIVLDDDKSVRWQFGH